MDLYALPYRHALGDGGPRPFTGLVVIHATDNTASAAAEASYATRRPDRTSAHFYVDDTEAYRALPLDNIAYGCLYHGNRISVQLELCGRSNQLTDATIRRAAPIVAELCRIYGIPVERVAAGRARAAYYSGGPGGICGHDTVTAAFPEDNGDHTDPGVRFPWDRFVGYVQAALTGGKPEMELTDMVPATNQNVGVVLSDLWNLALKGHSGFVPTDLHFLGQLGGKVDKLMAAAAADATRDAATTAAIQSLTDLVKAGGGNVDTAAILAAIQDAAAAAAATAERLQAELADAAQREHELRAQLAEAYAEPATGSATEPAAAP